MIPAGFEYHRPSDIASAVSILQEHGDEARVIAGGHSLIPMMKLRMADMGHLIDLQDIDALKGISLMGDTVTIGAMVTQHELITSATLANAVPIIKEAALLIADPQVRYVGTVGGNVANGDPGNDMPGLMQCLNASYELSGPDGTRTVAAREFYEAAYFTARDDEEILTRIHIPVPAAGTGYAYEKQKRKIGDYATAASAVMLRVVDGVCAEASIAMTNLADTPVFAEAASAALYGRALDDAAIGDAVSAAIEATDPVADNRGPVEFKKHVASVILRRAIDRAASRAS
ncbi:MAG: xanthine dehydrogenase family protein subunit M [Shimia sp.]|jgi:carbon-monoxide dehydrogenase medium subunit|uniref:FAD binding domain-containing protein n=1 Tax=Shimia sp. TaxID=1954381 RepID=UPI0025F0E805|nr:xanthine dehydrogenase family protein subunit M [Shimia sp.]MCH2069138.1 xanthine dehydrogenase family protein subunit M [Shimia sp.]